MTGFTANLSNLPPGVSPDDIDRHFGERDHHERCPQHDGWKPDRDTLVDVAYELVNVYDEELATWSLVSPARITEAVNDLRKTLAPPCSCDEETQADAEDAAERAAQENEGR